MGGIVGRINGFAPILALLCLLHGRVWINSVETVGAARIVEAWNATEGKNVVSYYQCSVSFVGFGQPCLDLAVN